MAAYPQSDYLAVLEQYLEEIEDDGAPPAVVATRVELPQKSQREKPQNHRQ